MPFRAKMKRALGRTNSSGALSKTDTAQSKKPKKEKLPNNVYKPGEKMPRLKYRGPWNQAHQDNLSSFSFGDAWKRRKSSANEEYSPMGSRLVSRRPSAWSRLSRLGSRKSSFVGGEEKGKVGSRRVSMAGLGEAEGDDDIGNGTLKPHISKRLLTGGVLKWVYPGNKLQRTKGRELLSSSHLLEIRWRASNRRRR